MLTREEKSSIIEREVSRINNSKSIVFIDFDKVKTGDINAFRKTVRVSGELAVIKKRLLRVAFERAGVQFNPEQFETQVGTIFSPEEIFVAAQSTVKFKQAKILGGYDLENKRFVSSEEVIMLGKLPSKEVLLSQVVGMIGSPIKSLLYVLSERSKQTV